METERKCAMETEMSSSQGKCAERNGRRAGDRGVTDGIGEGRGGWPNNRGERVS